jgi:hypothetical protein
MINKDIPAFPQPEPIFNEFHPNYGKDRGMTLRDYFAAQALTGAQVWDAVLNGKESSQFCGGVNKLAEVAYAVADAMMKARNENNR